MDDELAEALKVAKNSLGKVVQVGMVPEARAGAAVLLLLVILGERIAPLVADAIAAAAVKRGAAADDCR